MSMPRRFVCSGAVALGLLGACISGEVRAQEIPCTEEIRTLCHAATILRAGRVVGVVDPRRESPAGLARLMIGRDLPAAAHPEPAAERVLDPLGAGDVADVRAAFAHFDDVIGVVSLRAKEDAAAGQGAGEQGDRQQDERSARDEHFADRDQRVADDAGHGVSVALANSRCEFG